MPTNRRPTPTDACSASADPRAKLAAATEAAADNAAGTASNSPATLTAAALAHLAAHMQTRCPRAAALAAMLLERVACHPDADAHLRQHACQLADILDRDPELPRAASNGERVAASEAAAAVPHLPATAARRIDTRQ